MKNVFIVLLSIFIALVLSHCEATKARTGNKAWLSVATKSFPYENSLGMKFVPVPGTNILMCTTETTVTQYQASGAKSSPPDFPQSGNHPVVHISLADAKAWCAWISSKEGVKYRLPTRKEWQAAIGTGQSHPWGNQWPPPNNIGNYAGQEWRTSAAGIAYARRRGAGTTQKELSLFGPGVGEKFTWPLITGFRDSHVFTAPVASYAPNSLGIYDLGGNVSEWVGDKSKTSSTIGFLTGKNWKWAANGSETYGATITETHASRGDCGFRVVIEK